MSDDKLSSSNQLATLEQHLNTGASNPNPPDIHQRILDEDTYVDTLERIITRDFYPDLYALNKQNQHTDEYGTPRQHPTPTPIKQLKQTASANNNPNKTPNLSNKASSIHYVNGELLSNEEEHDMKHMDLRQFHNIYTSEDNYSFSEIMYKNQLEHYSNYPWIYEQQQIADDRNKYISILSGDAHCNENKKKDRDEEALKKKVDLYKGELGFWPFKSVNKLMFHPEADRAMNLKIMKKLQNEHGKPFCVYSNTRLPKGFALQTDTKPKLSQMEKNLRGYTMVHTPIALDDDDNPIGPIFSIPKVPKKDKIVHALNRKNARKKQEDKLRRTTPRTQIYTPFETKQILTPSGNHIDTPLVGLHHTHTKRKRSTKRPSSYHRRSIEDLSPAARKLMEMNIKGKHTLSTPLSYNKKRKRNDDTPKSNKKRKLNDDTFKKPTYSIRNITDVSNLMKQLEARKRDFSDESDNQEPLRKRRKIDILNNVNESKKWVCAQCTLENEITATKCAVCGIDPNSTSWDDDEDIDLDSFDGQIIYSLNNKDIEKRSRPITLHKESKEKHSTLNGLSYTECWICSQCQAINRLLETHTKYNMLCCICKRATYTPSTPIIKSFEWDKQSVSQESTINHFRPQNQAEALEFYEKRKQRKYNTKGIHNREADTLIMGMIHYHNVRTLSSIKLVPEDVIRLILLFHGELEYDGWDTFTNKEEFEIDNGLTTCKRTDNNKGLWRNAFGMREVKSIGKTVRYQWKLRINKTRNKDWEEELVDSVIIGVIESKGIKGNMGSSFTEYNDGWGLVGDGQKVTDGVYEKFNQGYTHYAVIKVTLQWIHGSVDKENCHLFFNDKSAYALDAKKEYKLAIAMNSREYALEWVSFDKYDDVLKSKVK